MAADVIAKRKHLDYPSSFLPDSRQNCVPQYFLHPFSWTYMVKSLIGLVVPGSSKLADECMLPLLMMVAISLVAGVVGTVGIETPALRAAPAMAGTTAAGCFASRWTDARDGFIQVGTQVQPLRDPCRM
jgi:hypothetical protein